MTRIPCTTGRPGDTSPGGALEVKTGKDGRKIVSLFTGSRRTPDIIVRLSQKRTLALVAALLDEGKDGDDGTS